MWRIKVDTESDRIDNLYLGENGAICGRKDATHYESNDEAFSTLLTMRKTSPNRRFFCGWKIAFEEIDPAVELELDIEEKTAEITDMLKRMAVQSQKYDKACIELNELVEKREEKQC